MNTIVAGKPSEVESIVLKTIKRVKSLRERRDHQHQIEDQSRRHKTAQRRGRILALLTSISQTLRHVLSESPTLTSLLEKQVRCPFNKTPSAMAKVLWQSLYASQPNAVSLCLVKKTDTGYTEWTINLFLNTDHGPAGWFEMPDHLWEHLPADLGSRLEAIQDEHKLIGEIVNVLGL